MKQLKLKRWVVPTLYIVSISIICLSVVFVGKLMSSDYQRAVEVNYVPDTIIEENETTTVVEVTNETVNHPYLLDSVSIAKDYYSDTATEENQIKSLIYYKNTYMENTGVLYTNSESFDIVSVLDGTITSITEDEILGKVVEVTHTTELVTIYHCLNEINVNIGDLVKQNDVIGTSGKLSVDDGYENALLFEVNYRGQIINPNDFYNMKVSDLIG